MTTEILIRHAADGDLDPLVRIYNHYIENTAVTFDTTPFSVTERIAWFTSFSEDSPHRLMVAERGDEMLGFASSAPFKNRPAYNTSVETSIYLAPDSIGSGVGTRLFGALLELLTADERLHRAYGGIALPNDASIALHEKFGFRLAGTYHEVGYKFDKYWDVARYEKDLSR
jgi:phosphinothricin acetyltransferase